MFKDKRYLFGLGSGLIIAAVLLELMRLAEAGTNTNLLPPVQPTQQVYTIDEMQRIAADLGYVAYDKSVRMYTQQEVDELLTAQPQRSQQSDAAGGEDAEAGQPEGGQTDGEAYSVYIKSGLSSAQVSELLVEAGLIADADSFTEEMETRGLAYKIRAGLYNFEEAPDLDALIKAITSR